MNGPIFLKLAMGLEDKIEKTDNKLEFGKISYASDTHNLYIDALKKDKVDVERQIINANKSYAIRDKKENIVAEYGIGQNSFKENYYTEAFGINSHAEGMGRKATAYLTGDAGAKSYKFEFIDGDFNQSDLGSMDQIHTPLVWVYENTDGLKTFATMTDSEEGTIYLTKTLSDTKPLNEAIVNVYSGGYALGDNSHSEGQYTKTVGESSHAEGVHTKTIGVGAHAEGYQTTAKGNYSHAEGSTTNAIGEYSHAEGYYSRATGKASHSEGYAKPVSIGDDSLFEGGAHGNYSHNEGFQTQANGDYSHAQGFYTYASGQASHAEGTRTESEGDSSHSEGHETFAGKWSSHAEGRLTVSDGQSSHAEGWGTMSLGEASHAEGTSRYVAAKLTGNANKDTYSISSFTLGSFDDLHIGDMVYSYLTKIVDSNANSEMSSKTQVVIAKIVSIDDKKQTITLDKTLSTNDNSFDNQVYIYHYYALGKYSHVEGNSTTALGEAAHAEGYKTKAEGNYSHASGEQTIASGEASSAFGKYNNPKNEKKEDYLFTVGNGTDKNRSNALSIEQDGTTKIYGPVYAISSNSTNQELKELATKEDVENTITDVFYRGPQPPEEKKMLWIRTGAGMGNGVLYYFRGQSETPDVEDIPYPPYGITKNTVPQLTADMFDGAVVQYGDEISNTNGTLNLSSKITQKKIVKDESSKTDSDRDITFNEFLNIICPKEEGEEKLVRPYFNFIKINPINLPYVDDDGSKQNTATFLNLYFEDKNIFFKCNWSPTEKDPPLDEFINIDETDPKNSYLKIYIMYYIDPTAEAGYYYNGWVPLSAPYFY